YGVPLRFPVGYVMFSSDNKGKTYGSSPVESRGPAQTLQITITDEEDGIKKMVINGTHEYVVRMSDVENGLAYNLGAVRANRVDEGSVISLIMFLAVLPFLYYSLIRTDEMVRTDYWNEQDPVDAGFEADPYEKMSIHYVAEVMVRNNSVHLRDWFGSHYAIDLTSGEMLIPRDSIGEIFVHPEKVLVPLAMMPYLFGKAAREETARCIEKRYKSVGDAKFSAEKAIFDALKEVVQNPTSSPVWNNQKNSGEPLEIIYVTNNKYQPFENGGLLKAELGVCIAVLDAGGMAHISPTTGHNAEDAPTLPEKKQKFLTRLLAHVGETKDSSIAIISSVQLERTMPIERDHIISVEDIMMFLLYQKKIDRSRILPIIGEAPKDVYLGANGRIRIVYYRGLDIYDEDIVSLFSSTPCNHGDLKDCSSEDFITSSPVGEAGYSGKRIERSHPGSVIFPEMLQSHSRGVIYLTFVPWSVHAVPERRAVPERERVEIFITPIEERTMKEEVLYLFWRAPSLLSRLWKWLKGFFEPMNAWFKDISRRGPLLSFRHPEHPLFLISEEMGTKDLDYHVEILPRQRSMAGQNDGGISSVNNPVGAVVASSAIVVDPTKGDPNDPVWRHFYENKLNPLTPRHDVYFPQFVQNFMDPSRADWHAFRQEIEADQNSPWQAVLVEVRKMEAGQHKSVEAAAPVPEKKPIEIIQPVVKTPESFWQGVREVPSIVRRWAGYTEVPVGIKTTIENVGENMVKVLLSDLESFEGMIRRLFPGFLSWFYRMGDWIARILVISKDVFIPIEYAPALASGLVINRGQVLKHLSPVNKAAVVAASSSPANDNSLKDPT
ncbi:MAG: hypothetical protein JW847_08205, partial [Candidatus Omnitrophica bacterium]|nr:hypothetical protein [Candidatus Omnitrophota bacterium]